MSRLTPPVTLAIDTRHERGHPPNESAFLFWNVVLDSDIEVKHLSIGRVCDGFSRFYSSTSFPWVQNYVSIVNTSEGIFSRIRGLENAQSLQSFLMWMNIWWQDASIIKRGSIITVLSSESIIRSVVPMESYLNKNKLDYISDWIERSRFARFPGWT